MDDRVCLASGRLGVRIYILFKIKSTKHKFLTYHKRSDQLIISRILIDYSKLTHAYVLKGEQQPECISYYCTYCTKTLLLNTVQSMQDLFTKVSTDRILEFSKESDFYNKIERFDTFNVSDPYCPCFPIVSKIDQVYISEQIFYYVKPNNLKIMLIVAYSNSFNSKKSSMNYFPLLEK